MADISKIITLNGTEYNLKDAEAREAIENLPAMNASFVGTALVIADVGNLSDAEEASF